MEEIKIGEVFQVGRVKLKCVEDFDDERCDNCAFYKLGGVLCAFLSNCVTRTTSDNNIGKGQKMAIWVGVALLVAILAAAIIHFIK